MEAVKILDTLINITCDGELSEEERTSKYDKLVEEIVFLVEEIVDNHKSHVFVKHVERHLAEHEEFARMNLKEKLEHYNVICKICGKTIDEIYEKEKQS